MTMANENKEARDKYIITIQIKEIGVVGDFRGKYW